LLQFDRNRSAISPKLAGLRLVVIRPKSRRDFAKAHKLHSGIRLKSLRDFAEADRLRLVAIGPKSPGDFAKANKLHFGIRPKSLRDFAEAMSIDGNIVL